MKHKTGCTAALWAAFFLFSAALSAQERWCYVEKTGEFYPRIFATNPENKQAIRVHKEFEQSSYLIELYEYGFTLPLIRFDTAAHFRQALPAVEEIYISDVSLSVEQLLQPLPALQTPIALFLSETALKSSGTGFALPIRKIVYYDAYSLEHSEMDLQKIDSIEFRGACSRSTLLLLRRKLALCEQANVRIVLRVDNTGQAGRCRRALREFAHWELVLSRKTKRVYR